MKKHIDISFPVQLHDSKKENNQIREFRKEHDPNDLHFTWFNRVTIFVIISASAVCAASLVYLFMEYRRSIYAVLQPIFQAIDDMPTWLNTCIVLFILCVVSVSYALVREGKKSRG